MLDSTMLDSTTIGNNYKQFKKFVIYNNIHIMCIMLLQ